MSPSPPGQQIEKGYVAVAEGQVHFRRAAGPGTPVIFLHRSPSSSFSFQVMLQRLAGRRAAIALDSPGFGGSFDPIGYPSTVDYGAWLLAAIDALGLNEFHLCGHHTGTHFAVEICRAAPGRVRSLTLSGVLYLPKADRLDRLAKMKPPPIPDENGDHLLATWRLVKTLFALLGPVGMTAEYVDAVRSLGSRRQGFDAILRQDFVGVLKSLSLPVQIVQPQDDPLDDMLATVAAENPHIPVHRVGPAGLMAPEILPEVFVDALLAFIDTIEKPGAAP